MRTSKARQVRAEFYRALAAELESHPSNGSGFVYQETDGSDSPRGVVSIREAILKRLVRMCDNRAWRLECKMEKREAKAADAALKGGGG